jgi:hypothetical protein
MPIGTNALSPRGGPDCRSVAAGAVSTRRLLSAEGSHVTKAASHTGSTSARFCRPSGLRGCPSASLDRGRIMERVEGDRVSALLPASHGRASTARSGQSDCVWAGSASQSSAPPASAFALSAIAPSRRLRSRKRRAAPSAQRWSARSQRDIAIVPIEPVRPGGARSSSLKGGPRWLSRPACRCS